MRCGQGVFFCKTRSFALRFLLANSHKRLCAAHGNALSKIFLDRTGPISDKSEHIFDNHYNLDNA
jgi:hypothetical protein